MYRILFLLFLLPAFLYGCPFDEGSEAIARQEVYSGELWRVLVDYRPVLPGHILIIPKRHLRDRSWLTREEHAELYDVEQLVHLALQERMGEGTDNFQMEKNGEKAGMSVPGHFHIHVYPMTHRLSRWELTQLLAQLLLFPAPYLSDEELAEEVALYKHAFEVAHEAAQEKRWQKAE